MVRRIKVNARACVYAYVAIALTLLPTASIHAQSRRNRRPTVRPDAGTVAPAPAAVAGRLLVDDLALPSQSVRIAVNFTALSASFIGPTMREMVARNDRWQELARHTGRHPFDSVSSVELAITNSRDDSWIAVANTTLDADAQRAALSSFLNEPVTSVRVPSTYDWQDGRNERSAIIADRARLVFVPRTDAARVNLALPAALASHASSITGRNMLVQARGVRSALALPPHYARAWRLSVTTTPSGLYIAWRGEFGSDAEAAAAVTHWTAERDRYVSQIALQLMGMSGILARAAFTVHGSELALGLELSEAEVDSLLAFGRPFIEGARRERSATPR